MNTQIKVPSSAPRVFSALQFGIVITVLFEVMFYAIGLISGVNMFQEPAMLLVTFVIGVLCVSPFFYTSDRHLGIDELRKGMYTVEEATIVAFEGSNMLLKVGNKQLAVSNPLLFNITYEDLTAKQNSVLYIKTNTGHEFITKN